MSVDVHEGLDRLAQQAPVGPPPGDLWRRGVRRRRRTVATAAAAGVLAVVAVGTGAGLVADRADRWADPEPAADASRDAMPAHVEAPSPWLRDDSSKGPLGRAAIVAGAERSSWRHGTVKAVFGVSARTGAYRFLDLPGHVTGDGLGLDPAVVLSPGGTHLAYWQGGTVRTSKGARTAGVTGVVDYDLATGRVSRLRLPARMGFEPKRLTWAGEDRLVVEAGRVTHRSSDTLGSNLDPPRVWEPATGQALAHDRTGLLEATGVVSLPGGGIAGTIGRVWRTWDTSLAVTGTHPVRGLKTGEQVVGGSVSPNRGKVALLAQDADTQALRLLVATVPTDRRGPLLLHAVSAGPGVRQVLGWSDERHVVAETSSGTTRRAWAIDVTDRELRLVTRVEGLTWLPGVAYAGDLWAGGSVARPGPPYAPDPRLVALGGTVAAGLVVGVVVWRRRRAIV